MHQDDSFEVQTQRPLPEGSRGDETVILVNEHDQVVGVEDKTRAHLMGSLHRAFSIFILNSDGQLLLQRRALQKYHSAGLWSNTCCGHPRPGETVEDASRRRLLEEMGFDAELRKLFNFIYYANLEEGLTEHEYDYVLMGRFEDLPKPDPDEVVEWKWADLATIRRDINIHPERYTYWFRISFDLFLRAIDSKPVL
jgi:isopentenyl-diphosphate delta-isomerase